MKFKVPDTYYDRPETRFWFQRCDECEWTSELYYSLEEVCDLEECPDCQSTKLYDTSEWL